MQDFQDNYLRFVSLRLRDYKIFGGVNDFRFNRHRTLIVGKGGTGKTTIVEALANLGPPKKMPGVYMYPDRPRSSAIVVTEGNSDLVRQCKDLIFLDCDFASGWALHGNEFKLKAKLKDSVWTKAVIEAGTIFEKILCYKPWKTEFNIEVLDVTTMGAGKKICFGYALVFALRKILKLDVPIVLDSPYGMLDVGLRKGLSSFLKAQPCQQILLGHECEFLDEEGLTYILVHTENDSHVMEF